MAEVRNWWSSRVVKSLGSGKGVLGPVKGWWERSQAWREGRSVGWVGGRGVVGIVAFGC